MAKVNNKTKAIVLSALVASTTAAVYANKDAIKNNKEANVDTAKLIVEKISKDKVKISIENVNDASKAFQLSLKIEGDVTFRNENTINWLTNIDSSEDVKTQNTIENDYVLSNNNKTIDIFVASDKELNKKGSTIEVCELNLSKSSLKSNSDYKIVPNSENGISYKSIDVNNKSTEVTQMDYDLDNILKFNTPPIITLKDSSNNDYPKIDKENKTITIKEGYAFKANDFVDISDEEDTNISKENIEVKDSDGNVIPDSKTDFKTGSYKINYTIKDSDNEISTLRVDLIVEPDVWKTKPVITGVPDEVKKIYTGGIFDVNKPNGTDSVIAKDAIDSNLDVLISGDFDLDVAGNYAITYSAKDKFDNTESKTLTLIVEQNDMPIINGVDDKVINRAEIFDSKAGVSAIDDGVEVTSENIKVSGSVNTNIAKKYTLNYEVADNKDSSKKTIVQRNITVNGAPSIYGDLSDIIVSTGANLSDEEILKGITVEDDLDENVILKLGKNNLDTSKDGTYTVEISATDMNGLTSIVNKNIIVTSKDIIELPNSGDGLSEEKSKQFRVLNESSIETINTVLSDLTKNNEVDINKTTLLDDVIYNIKVSENKIAYKNSKSNFVSITVPKSIDDKSPIKVDVYQSTKVSSININGSIEELKVGDSNTLTTVVSPQNADNKNLIWTVTDNSIINLTPSSDTQSATIKAIKKGTSTIRVIATDGSGVKAEVVVSVGEQPKEDTQAPVFDYKGKTKISLANGMNFETPYVTASDNVDTGIDVKVSIFNKDGLNVEKIDTTVPGEYTIKYTATDKSGNKAELEIKVNVKKAISNVTIGNGNAISKDSPLEINALSDINGLNILLDEIKKDNLEAKVDGSPIINKDKNEAIYTINLYKKEGLLSKLFNLNKNNESYYLKLTVKNDKEFTDILSKLPLEKPPTEGESGNEGESENGGSGGGSVIPDPDVPKTVVSQIIGEDRFETAVKISKEGWNISDTIIIVNGNDKNLVDGLTATPLASAKNAPILLSNNKELPKFTIDEIKRLSPSKVIVIGGEISMPENIINEIKKINSKIDVQRIGGQTRYETSLNIAKEIDKIKNITKIYVGAGYGEADSLSISSVAGRDKAPIILTEKDGLDKDTYEYIKSQNVLDGYVIGGDVRISDKAIKQIDGIVSKDISANRISGAERQDTNAKVIEKFYSNTQLDGVVIAKDYDLVDALAVGPLASKKDIPVVLATNSLSKSQEEILTKKKSAKIYETGGGIKAFVIDKLKVLVNNRK